MQWMVMVAILMALMVLASSSAALGQSRRAGSADASSGDEAGKTPAADFYVAPDGNDAHPGTRDRPFATVARARDAVRARVAAGPRAPVVVLIRGGTYALAEPLRFGTEDSGTETQSVTYAAFPGERVVLSGARRIAGWTRDEGGVWTAEVPEARTRAAGDRPNAARWAFRQLFVAGRRATRARTPNADDPTPCWQVKQVEKAEDLKRFALAFEPGTVANWKNLADVEVVVLKNWAVLRKRLAGVDAAAGVATLAPPHVRGNRVNRARAGSWAYFENAREMLDRPGEWYLDRRAGRLAYWPREGEDMTRAEVVAPVLEHVLVVAGTAERPVRNLHFRGLTVAHADRALPAGGHDGQQAFFSSPKGRSRPVAAVEWRYTRGCSFRDGGVAHVGGTGLALGEGCSQNVIEGNAFSDIGGNGLMVGLTLDPGDSPRLPRENRVANNLIHTCGVDYPGAVGLWVGFAADCRVVHNRLRNLPYTGISVGWQWNPDPTSCKGHLIAYNHVSDCMKMLADGGGIYTLGFQPGTVLRANLIHDVHRSRYAHGSPNNGIFFDEGSKGFRVEGQVIYDTSGRPIRFNQSHRDWHAWGENILGERPADGAGPATGAGPEPPYAAAFDDEP